MEAQSRSSVITKLTTYAKYLEKGSVQGLQIKEALSNLRTDAEVVYTEEELANFVDKEFLDITKNCYASYTKHNRADTNNMFNMVTEFHEIFGHPICKDLKNKVDVDPKNLPLRVALFEEEYQEYLMAMTFTDIVDAITDMFYVGFGTMVAGFTQEAYRQLGLVSAIAEFDQFDFSLLITAFAEVHNSNLSKLGADGNPIYLKSGKIGKGPDFRHPALRPIAKKWSEDCHRMDLRL